MNGDSVDLDDQAAIERVVKRALRMTPQSDQDDVRQVAALALWETQRRDNGRGCDATARHAYLRLRVRGDLLDEYRRRCGRNFKPVLVELETSHEPVTHPTLDTDIDATRAVDILKARLKPRDWQCLSLVYLHDVEQKLVAQEQGISEGRLSHNLTKAKNRAAKVLAGLWE
jgi:RNA polymerase sigma factor (sigma-70 family)